MEKVSACIKDDQGRAALSTLELPEPGPGQALIRTELTTICGSDIHILEDIPEVPAGTPMGHEAVGVVEAVGEGVERFGKGDRVVACCVTSCGSCERCSGGEPQLCQTFAAPFNLLFGAQAEAFLVAGADHSMAALPKGVDDRQALFASDIMSTGFGALERAHLAAGQSVAVFAQGPVGLCATAAAAFYRAEPIVAVESIPERVEMARRLGATHVLSPKNAVEEIMELSKGQGVDVAVEALGKQETFENCCRVTRLGGTISSVGVYGGIPSLSLPTDGTFIHRSLVTTLCPGGSSRLEHLLDLVESGRVDLTPLITHECRLGEVVAAYDMFRNRREGAIKIALRP